MLLFSSGIFYSMSSDEASSILQNGQNDEMGFALSSSELLIISLECFSCMPSMTLVFSPAIFSFCHKSQEFLHGSKIYMQDKQSQSEFHLVALCGLYVHVLDVIIQRVMAKVIT